MTKNFLAVKINGVMAAWLCLSLCLMLIGFHIGRRLGRGSVSNHLAKGYVQGATAALAFWQPRWNWLAEQHNNAIQQNRAAQEQIRVLAGMVQEQQDAADWWKYGEKPNEGG